MCAPDIYPYLHHLSLHAALPISPNGYDNFLQGFGISGLVGYRGAGMSSSGDVAFLYGSGNTVGAGYGFNARVIPEALGQLYDGVYDTIYYGSMDLDRKSTRLNSSH